tara:strand:+ start:8906 stop:11572 length:2667 start_codon:yes stop_codon:yes gene_type:complete
MANINFYGDINLKNNQLKEFKVYNVAGGGSGNPGGEGQLVYDTTGNVLQYHIGGGTWVTLQASSGAGTVTSVGLTMPAAFTVSNSPITTAGTLAVTGAGSTAQYIRGDGTLATFPAIPQGDITSVLGGAGITVTNSTGPSPSVAVDYLGADNVVLAAASGTAITVVAGDRVLLSDTSDSGNAKFVNISQLTTAIGGGTVTSVGLAAPSAFTVSGSPVTGSGTLTLAGAGSSSQYIDGTGALQTFPAIPSGSFTVDAPNGLGTMTISSGDTFDFENTFYGGVYMEKVPASDQIKIGMDISSMTTVGAISSLDYFAIQDSSQANNSYRVLVGTLFNAINWTLAGDSGTSQTITNGNTASFEGGANGIISTAASATDTLTITHALQSQSDTVSTSSPGSAGTFTAVDSVTRNSTGHVTALNTKTITMPTVPAAYSGWLLTGDAGTNANITAGATVDIQGGTGISTSANGFILDISNDGVLSNIAGTGIGVSGATGNVTISNTGVTSIIAGSNIGVSSATGAVTVSYTGGTGTMSSFILAGDSGANQTISNGNTLSILGSVGIDTAASATDDLTITLDLNELPTTATWTDSSDTFAVVDGTANARIKSTDIDLGNFGTSMNNTAGTSQKITNLAPGTAGTDGVNVNQLNAAVVGLLEFKGGFNASTGVIDGGATNLTVGAARVAIAVGDFYVVTTAGNFFGNAATPLTPGDQVIATEAAAAGASVESDFVVVQSDTDLATATTVGLANFPTAGGLVVSTGAVSMATVGGAGSVGSASQSLSVTTNDKGIVTAKSAQSIQIGASQVTNFCTEVESCVNAGFFYQVTFGNNSDLNYTISHGFNTTDVMCQIYEVSSGDTIYAEVERTSATAVTVRSNTAPGTNAWRILVTNVSA